LLQLADHYDRLAQSARILMMKPAVATRELCDLTVEICARNKFRSDVYVRPFSYQGERGHRRTFARRQGRVRDGPPSRSSGTFDAQRGLKVGVSSWRRIDDTMAPAAARFTGTYVNSALAKSDAVMNGFDEAIMLSQEGHVCEGSAENVFLVRGGVPLHARPVAETSSEGVTRRAIMTLAEGRARRAGRRARDRPQRAGSSPTRSSSPAAPRGSSGSSRSTIARSATGIRGPIATALIDLYDRATRGGMPKYASWLTRTYAGR